MTVQFASPATFADTPPSSDRLSELCRAPTRIWAPGSARRVRIAVAGSTASSTWKVTRPSRRFKACAQYGAPRAGSHACYGPPRPAPYRAWRCSSVSGCEAGEAGSGQRRQRPRPASLSASLVALASSERSIATAIIGAAGSGVATVRGVRSFVRPGLKRRCMTVKKASGFRHPDLAVSLIWLWLLSSKAS